ncbi:DUF3145 family protein [Kitasatospora sp. MBT63]|uniref:DUF3145 family protein n=1 Tax=Kitasatospora sp. MBT63 TaxID=1444768 RepID=UPI00053B2FC9|nr:DUF3145 family protein [Kitasatospora sp. MBT63]
MGDRSPLQCWVHQAEPADHPAILEILADHKLSTDAPAQAAGSLALGTRYMYLEALLGSSDALAAELQRSAPSAVFELWQDPYPPTADGHYVGHVPGTGTHEGACNEAGELLIPVREVREILGAAPAGLTVEMWLATEGRKHLGTAVLARLAAFERRW